MACLSFKVSARESARWIGYVKAVSAGCVVLSPLPAFTSAAPIINTTNTLLDALEANAATTADWVH